MRLKHVLRRLGRTPMFTAITVLTLGIGIGANSAIFSVIRGITLKPLPYSKPDELIDLTLAAPGVNLTEADEAPFFYFTYRDNQRSFQSVGLYHWTARTVTGLAEPEQAQGLDVTQEVLPMLGVQPAIGRWFSEKDTTPGSPVTMILMPGWWQERFGGDRSVIGRKIVVDGIQCEVIGVMPPNFRFLDREAAFVLPLRFDRSKEFLGNISYPGIARMKPGVTIEQASADVARMIPIALHSFPPSPGFTVKDFENVRFAPKFKPLREHLIGGLAKTLWVIMGTIALVLLIACANVANLLLVRAEGRQQELAIRAALGAGWREIARELLMESIALGLLGGALGLGIAYSAIRVLIALAPSQLPRLHEISIDPAVAAFTLATAVLSGVLFGMMPVMKYAGTRIAPSVRGGGRNSSQSRERHRARNALVIVQVALALVLLVGSGLMIRTFQALRQIDPGFDPKDALSMRISIPATQVKDATQTVQMEQAILDKIRAIPGVTAAGASTGLPTEIVSSYQVYARDKIYTGTPPLRLMKFVSPGLLAAMGNRLVAGREFTWVDTYERRRVAIVSENLARELWGDPRAAIGKEIRESQSAPWREVVGVVNDERDEGVQADAPPGAYYPLLMNDFQGQPVSVKRALWYVVRTKRAGTQSLLADVQQAVWSINPNLPLANVRTLEEVYRKSLARTSFTLVMLAMAGAMALLIGLVGLYGVISYAVSQRTREIGIRVALGAREAQVTRLFVREGLVLAAIGVAAGLAASAALTRAMGSLLYGVNPIDPLTYVLVAAGLVAAAGIASFIPSMRAASVNPVDALRAEH